MKRKPSPCNSRAALCDIETLANCFPNLSWLKNTELGHLTCCNIEVFLTCTYSHLSIIVSQRICLSSNLLTLAWASAAVLRCSRRSVCNDHVQPCRNPGKPLTFCHQKRIFSPLFNTVLRSAGVHQAVPGLPQRGPLWRSPAVLGLIPAASHETFKLVRLPAALRLIPPHLLTDWRLRGPMVPNIRIVRVQRIIDVAIF